MFPSFQTPTPLRKSMGPVLVDAGRYDWPALDLFRWLRNSCLSLLRIGGLEPGGLVVGVPAAASNHTRGSNPNPNAWAPNQPTKRYLNRWGVSLSGYPQHDGCFLVVCP